MRQGRGTAGTIPLPWSLFLEGFLDLPAERAVISTGKLDHQLPVLDFRYDLVVVLHWWCSSQISGFTGLDSWSLAMSEPAT